MTDMNGPAKTHRSVDASMVQAWLAAARDLGIRVTAPFTLPSESGGVEMFEALIHDFGGPKGTVVGRIAAEDPIKSRSQYGYYASNLSDSYQHYERAFFIATLDDWKWYGSEEDRPYWYTGQNWS